MSFSEGYVDILAISWSRRLDDINTPKLREEPIKFKEIAHLFPIIYRTIKETIKAKREGKNAINVFSRSNGVANTGLPLGTIGSGTINRGWRGDFYRWQFRPGIFEYNYVPADQFSVFIETENGEKKSLVLNTIKPSNNSLSSWDWSFNGQDSVYYALFPRAWTIYNEIIPGLTLKCKQFSPVIPNNYKESSYPVTIFEWSIENKSKEQLAVSVMFSFQNGTGNKNDGKGGHVNRAVDIQEKGIKYSGVVLDHTYRSPNVIKSKKDYEDKLEFVILTEKQEEEDVKVTRKTFFITNSDGQALWSDFSSNGELEDNNDYNSKIGEKIGGALAVKVIVPAQTTKQVNFALAWDMPLARFGLGRAYYRRYTKFFGREGNNAPKIAIEALRNYKKWEEKINDWQMKIISDQTLPKWLKGAIFNELYYIVEGGTLWTDGEEGQEPPPKGYYGKFAYLESHQYSMYNTYDVHFYASFALASLWPQLELSIQEDFAKAVLTDSEEEHVIAATNEKVKRSVRGSVPHDIGSPAEDPFYLINSYIMWNIGKWKDLNPKFILQVYRDYYITKDKDFLKEKWLSLEESFNYALNFDRDKDGIIENDGFPDQTYDVWSVKGPSAYTGGLWLAALTALKEIAKILGKKEKYEEISEILEKGKKAYIEKLWNSRYFNYDSSKGKYSDSIMADQLAGLWYCKMTDLEPYIDDSKAIKTLRTIYNFNVNSYYNGTMGAVNGMRPNRKVDRSWLQSREVWTGTTYALASLMIVYGMKEEGFRTAEGIYRTAWEKMGYWFQTPEAWDEKGRYRALSYMRPLAIWAIEWAINKKQKK